MTLVLRRTSGNSARAVCRINCNACYKSSTTCLSVSHTALAAITAIRQRYLLAMSRQTTANSVGTTNQARSEAWEASRPADDGRSTRDDTRIAAATHCRLESVEVVEKLNVSAP